MPGNFYPVHLSGVAQQRSTNMLIKQKAGIATGLLLQANYYSDAGSLPAPFTYFSSH